MKLSIKYKIFFTLLLASITVAISLHYFLRWSFDRGFSKYIQSQELEQLDRLSETLIDLYQVNGNWYFLTANDHLWRKLHIDMAAPDHAAQEKGQMYIQQKPPRPFAPHRGPNGLGPRVVLFDAEKQRVIGAEDKTGKWNSLELRPLRDEEETLGYLGLIPHDKLQYARDRNFVKKQTDLFAFIAIFMVALSILLSFPVTIHLLRPINALTKGTRKLIAGHFKTRIPVTTKDELGRLSNDFNILAMTLEKNEQNRRQWVADVSHELRTPLAILRGEIEAIEDGIRKPDAKTIEVLHGEVMHLERMVSDLYELSMSDIGALNYKMVAVDLEGILQGTVEQFRQRVDPHKIAIQMEVAGDGIASILADPDRLQQLFINLLENSTRYTDAPGEIKVTLHTDKGKIRISFEDSAPCVLPDQLPQLFDRLYRAEGSRNRSTGGAGLGLAICKNIVGAHQGTITADNSPLGGLLITVEITPNV